MRTIKTYIQSILAVSILFQPSAYTLGNDHSILLNNMLVDQFTQSPILLNQQQSFKQLIQDSSMVIDKDQLEYFEKEFSHLMDQQVPEIQISAQPWLRFMIKDQGQWHTLSFHGTESTFMSLNGQAISWEDARVAETLVRRVEEIMQDRRFSLLELLIPVAQAQNFVQRNRPLIIGGSVVLAAVAMGYFIKKAADKVSKAKTTHTVIVKGIPDKISTDHKIDLGGKGDYDVDLNLNTKLGFESKVKFEANERLERIIDKFSSTVPQSQQAPRVRNALN